MNLFEPFLTRQQTNRLSFGACLVVGMLLILVFSADHNPRAAIAALPLCFLLWGWVNLVFADRNAPHGSVSRKMAFGSLPVPIQWVLFIGLVALVIFLK